MNPTRHVSRPHLRLPLLWSLAVLGGGCSAVFVSELPPGCEVEDGDGDGALTPECVVGDGVPDCDDSDPRVHPGAEESCNQRDDDCDGAIDEGQETRTIYADCDGDGVGRSVRADVCGAPMPFQCPDGHTTAWVRETDDCDDNDPTRQRNCGTCAQVDLLIVMDTSSSMEEEQLALARQLSGVVEALRTGRIDETQVAEPVQDLHVGVITPDLGVGTDLMPRIVPGCDPGFGDDGLLQTDSAVTDGSCREPVVPPDAPFLSFSPVDDATQFAADWSCLVRAGVDGCGFEHPLDAALKALTPADSSIRFRGETLGHQDGLNRGFLREDSLLVVVIITDNDDCSAADPDLFSDETGRYPGELSLRCHEYPEALSPISRYVSGLLQVREAEDLIFAMVAGLPRSVEATSEPDFDAILALPGMQERVNSGGTALVPSCTRRLGGAGSAFPPRRLLQTAAGLVERGSTAVVSSICSFEPYRALAGSILASTLSRSGSRCLRRLP